MEFTARRGEYRMILFNNKRKEKVDISTKFKKGNMHYNKIYPELVVEGERMR